MYQGIVKVLSIFHFSVRVYADWVQECSNQSGNLCFNPASTPKTSYFFQDLYSAFLVYFAYWHHILGNHASFQAPNLFQ